MHYNALSQSPITAQQFFEWNTKLHNDEILVREIIDILRSTTKMNKFTEFIEF